MSVQDNIVFILEIIGTVAFAVSGALVGIRRSMDIFGVCVLGVVTAVGGGAIRDVAVGIIPPNVFRDPVYATVAVLVSCLVFGIMYFRSFRSTGRLGRLYDGAMLLMDAVGLGIFTVVGVNAGIQQGYGGNAFLLIFTGTVTGVGGGLLRDIMAGVPPYIFVRHIYACASIAGAVACTLLYRMTGHVRRGGACPGDTVPGLPLPVEPSEDQDGGRAALIYGAVTKQRAENPCK